MTCERCEFLHNCNRQCMGLPEGKHCGDCENFKRCSTLFGAKEKNTFCEFEPVRFIWKEVNGMDKNREKYIADEWFKNHEANYQKYSDTTSVLNFSNPETVVYSVTYIFNNNYLIITGDIGEAVFCLTEKADIKEIVKYGTDYLFGKLRIGEKNQFNAEKAVSEFVNEMETYKEDIENDELEEFEELIREFSHVLRNEVSNAKHLEYFLNKEYYERIEKFDEGCAEWIYDIGMEMSNRALGWQIGLKLAYEQLKSQGVEL